jgi:hypothetical protein
VQDVVLRDRKRRADGKMSALVVFATKAAADQAVLTVTGDPSSPLLVLPLLKEPPLTEEVAAAAAGAGAGVGPSQQQQQQQQQQPLFPGAAPAFPVGGGAAGGLFPVGAAGGGGGGGSRGGGGFPSGSSFSSFPGASFGSIPGAGGAGADASGAASFEGSILDKMRKAAEREKLIAEMQAREGGD